jgi:hypothetical protein
VQKYREKNPEKFAQILKDRWARMTPEEKEAKNERQRIAREKKRIEEGRPKRVPKPKKEPRPKKEPMTKEERAAKERERSRRKYHEDPKKSVAKVARWRLSNPDARNGQIQRRNERMKAADPDAWAENIRKLKSLPINPESNRLRRRRQGQRQRQELRDKHVAKTMGLRVSICPKDLLEAKRGLILARRQLKQQQQPDQQHAPES